MARPRKYNVNIPGLSCFTDARTKKVYWRYKHPLTGKFHGLGTDEASAKEIATEANMRLAQNQMANMLRARDEIAKISALGITAQTWIEKYLKIQSERLEAGEIKENTVAIRKTALKAFTSHCGIRPLQDIGTRDIAAIIDEYSERGKARMGQIVRAVLIDVFKEAQHAGEVSPGNNPALATKNPRSKVTRQRLSLDEWKSIYMQAQNMQPWVAKSMLLAMVTGQRLSDIADMKFADIWDDALHVQQQKTGSKVAIPLSLRCDALDISLKEVIALCRDSILSPWVLHQHHTTGNGKLAAKLNKRTITLSFSKARDLSGLNWESGTAPTFHEQRSLSERLYRDQGIDTQILLGHKNSNMTDKYNDDRGKEWKLVGGKL